MPYYRINEDCIRTQRNNSNARNRVVDLPSSLNLQLWEARSAGRGLSPQTPATPDRFPTQDARLRPASVGQPNEIDQRALQPDRRAGGAVSQKEVS